MKTFLTSLIFNLVLSTSALALPATPIPKVTPLALGCSNNPSQGGRPICVLGGTGGPCVVDGECDLLGCNEKGQCVAGGLGAPCVNADSCSRPRCDLKTRACVIGGGGRVCTSAVDCLKKTCDLKKEELECTFDVRVAAPACSITRNCELLKFCTADKRCVAMNEVGGPPIYGLCFSADDCKASPQRCEKGKCVPDWAGLGPACTKDLECSQKKQCKYTANSDGRVLSATCVLNGDGQRCESASDCGHTQCTNTNACEFVPGAGPNLCTSNSQCGGHTECIPDKGRYGTTIFKCGIVRGSEPDRCKETRQCETVGTKCIGGTTEPKCVEDRSSTTRQCGDAMDCMSSKCVDGKCKTFYEEGDPVPGPRECRSDDACSHNACNFEKGVCDSVPGLGPSTCTADRQCGHLECRTMRCISVPGGVGLPDKCKTDNECGRSICRDQTCTRINEAGNDECENNIDCEKSPPGYTPNPVSTRPLPTIAFPIQPGYPPSQNISAFKSNGSDMVFGKVDAPVRVDIFMDYTCGMCAKLVGETFKLLRSELIEPGVTSLHIFDYPLGNFAESRSLGNAARCAHDQGKYFEFIGALMAATSRVAVNVSQYAKLAGIPDLSRFTTCVSSKSFDAKISSGYALAIQLSIDGTPEVMVNGKHVGGALSYQDLRAYIRQEQNALAQAVSTPSSTLNTQPSLAGY